MKGGAALANGMKAIAWGSLGAMLVFRILYQAEAKGLFATLAITAGTVAYHFWMRLLVGGVFDRWMKNKADYHRKWFRVGKAEEKFYELLRVNRWKRFFPTYDPKVFDRRQHTWDEIAQATCQSELVHETIVLLSFLPILASFWFGAAGVFVLTSLCSALFDLLFVVIQRYNRPRILRILSKRKRLESRRSKENEYEPCT